MKWTAILPPVAALAVGLSWIGREHMVLHQLQDDQDLLRQCIAAAHQAGAGSADDQDRAGGLVDSAKKAKQKIDWKKVLESQVSGQNGPENMRLMMELQQRFMGMSEDEILAEIDEIEKLDTSDAGKRQLESMLVQVLSEKNPELVLEKFSSWLSKDREGWQLSNAFNRWLKKDSAAAIQWFDRKIGEGMFDSKSLDGRNQARTQFETGVLSSLMGQDPAAAKSRLMDMPEAQRSEVFENLSYQIKPGTEAAVADTVRATMPAEQVPMAMANLASRMASQGFDQVDRFIAAASLSPEEKSAIVAKTLENRMWSLGAVDGAEAKLDEARAWAVKQSADSADRLTGEALSNAAESVNFDAASKLALKYAESSSNDDVLSAFLSGPAGTRNPDKALPLADKIKDPAKRDQILQKIAAAKSGDGQ